MKIDWHKFASIGICTVILVFFIFLLGKYLLSVLLPFIIAFSLASLTNSISKPIQKRIGIQKKICSATVLLLLFLAIGFSVYFGVTRLITELENFISGLTQSGSAINERITKLVHDFNGLSSKIPLVREINTHEHFSMLGERLDEILNSTLKKLATSLGTLLTTLATGFLKSLPSALAFILITIISSFYFALDYDNIVSYILSILPDKVKSKLPILQKNTKSLAVRYLKAYSLLMIITFFELLLGFTVLGVNYTFLLALLISFLDILPVFGVGTALIPWAFFEFFTYDFRMGFGLLIVWATVAIIRQITEPKIVGTTIGLHPITTLIGLYVGFKLFGVLGMFLSPAVLLGLRMYFSGTKVDTKIKK